MPLIRIENYPQQIVLHEKPAVILHNNAAALHNPNPDMNKWKAELAHKMAVAFVRAELPGIKHDKQVHVVFGGQQIRHADQTIIISVEGLFQKTQDSDFLFQRLPELLGQTALKVLPQGWCAEVMLNCHDPRYTHRGTIEV